MNCKICGKRIIDHESEQVKKCLEEAGIVVEGREPLEVAREAGASISINYRHKVLTFKEVMFHYHDINQGMLKMCLAGDNIKKPRVKKEEKEESKKVGLWRNKDEEVNERTE